MTSNSKVTTSGDYCSQEYEFLISLEVESLKMTDEDEEELYKDVVLVFAWEGNVTKIQKTQGEPEEFREAREFSIRSTPENLTKKLKTSPFMINLSRDCKNLGTDQVIIKHHFADAVSCENFNSQRISISMQFKVEDDENATMSLSLKISRMPIDKATENLFQIVHKQLLKQKKKKMRKEKEEESEDAEDEDSCEEFKCFEELSEQCQQNLKLEPHVYRIINGNLINVQEKIGICGEKCKAARKIVKNLGSETENGSKMTPKLELNQINKLVSSPPEVFIPCEATAVHPELNESKLSSTATLKKTDWIERNIQEESLLRKLCEKYGIEINEIRAIGEKQKIESSKKTKKRKAKKSKKLSTSFNKESLEEMG